MRPSRSDIAAPPFPPDTAWIGGAAPAFERVLADRPALVHFFDFAQLNSVRAMPYLSAWTERFAGAGLAVLGVHSPRFTFTREPDAVAAALPGLEIGWPVALDPVMAIWRDYGCHGWPSVFLWGKGGTLRWYHLGEGEYQATEEAIRESLIEAGADPGAWPPPLEPLRPGDAPGAEVVAPSPEHFPGGAIERPWSPTAGEPSLSIDFEAAGAYAAVDGEGEIEVRLDGERLDPVGVEGPGLERLADDGRHGRHSLELEPATGVRIHSIQFAAGPPFRQPQLD